MYSQRVSSKIGTTTNHGEFLQEWTLEEQNSGGTPAINYTSEEYLKTAERGLQRTYKDLGMDSLKLSSQYTFHSIPAFIQGADETEQYYFHPDHLGSSNYITNFVGTVTQHMEYFAFGETFVEEHKNSHNSPYKYNGKELDEETGWYYYGARFYDPRTSLWLSVDPLVEKYQGWSPYVYCAQNPINVRDPDGNGWYWSSGTHSFVYDSNINSPDDFKTLGIPGWYIPESHNMSRLAEVKSKNVSLLLNPDGSYNDNTVMQSGNGLPVNIPNDGSYNKREIGFGTGVYAEQNPAEKFSFSDLWNSPLARYLIPDKLSISFSSSATAFVGFNKDLSFNWITRGHDAKLTPYVLMTIGVQGGPQVTADALINFSAGYYATTDLRNLSAGEAKNGLLGWSIYGSADAGAILGGTATGSVGFTNPLEGNFTPTWISGGVGVGASIGAGATGGVSYTWPISPSQFKKND